ncbi:MAG: hypothetical protein FD153_1522 [Rhodospirillaceae bacterium]|nr:MAG: hypothetical protein FD153_1522 [Rhodospirillaceae bacterium]
MAVAFDTLRLARKLEAAGFEQKQAADIAEARRGHGRSHGERRACHEGAP